MSPTPDLPTPLWNHLLAAVPDADRGRISPHLEPVWLPLGKALYESGGQMESVYFPTTAIVSLLYELHEGGSAEISVIGREGVVGIALFMGGNTVPDRSTICRCDTAWRFSPRWRRRRCAIGIVPWTSSSADGCS